MARINLSPEEAFTFSCGPARIQSDPLSPWMPSEGVWTAGANGELGRSPRNIVPCRTRDGGRMTGEASRTWYPSSSPPKKPLLPLTSGFSPGLVLPTVLQAASNQRFRFRDDVCTITRPSAAFRGPSKQTASHQSSLQRLSRAQVEVRPQHRLLSSGQRRILTYLRPQM